MPTYNSGITRAGSGSDPLVPEPVSNDIIQNLPQHSALLGRARHITMPAKTQRLPVLDVLPQAYWVAGDNGMKQTTSQSWANVNLVAEELAAIVPIPEAYLSDADVPIWSEVQPRLSAALGQLIDKAGLFGTNKPTSWPAGIVPGAIAAGNYVNDSGADTALEVTQLGQQLANDGFALNGFIARPGLTWKLVGLRSSGSGVPIYQQDLQGKPGGSLYGYPLNEVNNGAFDVSTAQLVGGDWDKAIVGIRQDISFKLFTEGVISDDSGNVVLNLMQQDSVAMRVVMRLGFAVANPVTELNSSSSSRYPFSVLKTGSYSS